jgi:cyclophilin family peptidyl-prolyl cis-trans isomerase
MKNRINPATGRLLSNQRLMLTIPLVLTILLFIVGCGGSGAPTPTNPPPADSTKPDVASGVADLPPGQRADYYQARPAITIDTNRTYQATIQTSKGDIVVSLDAKAAPEHVNNFIFLSNEGFYNGLTFHRVEPGFVIQGGDPLGVGNGGPGYTVPGEFSLKHVEGALAMARLPDQMNPDRESSGSQFYITLAPTEFLDGEYSVFGKVEQGMDVVRSIQVGDTINQIVVEP